MGTRRSTALLLVAAAVLVLAVAVGALVVATGWWPSGGPLGPPAPVPAPPRTGR